jgi:hypothetical protein
MLQLGGDGTAPAYSGTCGPERGAGGKRGGAEPPSESEWSAKKKRDLLWKETQYLERQPAQWAGCLARG